MKQIKASNTSFSLNIVNGSKIALFAISMFLTFLIVSCGKNEREAEMVKGSYQIELEELTKKYEKGDTVALKTIVRMMQDCPDRNTCKDMAHNLFQVAEQYTKDENHNLAIQLCQAGKFAAEKSGNEEIRIAYYVELAFNYFRTAEKDSLRHYIHLAESFPFEKFSLNSNIEFLLTRAFMAESQSKYLEAMEFYLRAYSLVRGQHALKEATVLDNIGVLYLKIKNYKRALSYFKESLPIYEMEGDTSRLIGLYLNMGIAYKDMDSLTLASAMLNKCLALSDKRSMAYARGLANYGNVLIKLGDYQQASVAFDSSTAICKDLGVSYGVLINYINKANLFLEMKKARQALEILEEIQDSPFLVDRLIRIEVYRCFLKAYEELNNIQQVLLYQKKVIDLENELNDSNQDLLALEFEEHFLRQIKEQELTQMSHALKISRQQQRMGFLAGLFALFTLIFIIRLFYLRKQKQQLQSKLLEEEGENLRLQLELKERELTSQTIHLQSIGEFADDISSRLTHLRNKVAGESAEELTLIIKDFKNGIPEELWDEFRLRFEKVNEEFYQNLLNIAPDLTPAEIKIASFLRLNLSSKEISRLTNRTSGTIINTRTSLRKKLHLKEDDNLVTFLMAL